jgi:hypothetical protein
MEISNNDINLLIKKKGNNKCWKKILINYSILSDYENICKEVNNTYYDKNVAKKDFKPMEIYLDHPKLNKIIVYNRKDWNFLYNNKIIKECISEHNKIKIDYTINKIENIDENKKQQNFKRILIYILENISMDFYYNTIFKFFNEHKEIKKLFKLYFLKELIKTCDEEKESNKKVNNNDIIKDLDKSKEKLNANKYLIKTEDFFDISKKNIEKYLKKLESFNNIKNIIGDIDKKQEEMQNISEITENTSYNAINDEESIEFILNQVFEKDIKFKKNDKNNFDEKIKKLDYNEYMSELIKTKDNLNRFIYRKFDLKNEFT